MRRYLLNVTSIMLKNVRKPSHKLISKLTNIVDCSVGDCIL
jgi:hypothetical protein